MQHLALEFSTENILAIVEMTQFQIYYINKRNKNGVGIENENLTKIRNNSIHFIEKIMDSKTHNQSHSHHFDTAGSRRFSLPSAKSLPQILAVAHATTNTSTSNDGEGGGNTTPGKDPFRRINHTINSSELPQTLAETLRDVVAASRAAAVEREDSDESQSNENSNKRSTRLHNIHSGPNSARVYHRSQTPVFGSSKDGIINNYSPRFAGFGLSNNKRASLPRIHRSGSLASEEELNKERDKQQQPIQQPNQQPRRRSNKWNNNNNNNIPYVAPLSPPARSSFKNNNNNNNKNNNNSLHASHANTFTVAMTHVTGNNSKQSNNNNSNNNNNKQSTDNSSESDNNEESSKNTDASGKGGVDFNVPQSPWEIEAQRRKNDVNNNNNNNNTQQQNYIKNSSYNYNNPNRGHSKKTRQYGKSLGVVPYQPNVLHSNQNSGSGHNSGNESDYNSDHTNAKRPSYSIDQSQSDRHDSEPPPSFIGNINNLNAAQSFQNNNNNNNNSDRSGRPKLNPMKRSNSQDIRLPPSVIQAQLELETNNNNNNNNNQNNANNSNDLVSNSKQFKRRQKRKHAQSNPQGISVRPQYNKIQHSNTESGIIDNNIDQNDENKDNNNKIDNKNDKLNRSRLSLSRSQRNRARNPGRLIVELPKNLPKSSIVFSEILSIQEKSKSLLQKYVIHNAEHELNLPSRLRNALMDCYENIFELTDFQCEYLFDDIIREILKLMQDSFSRFEGTKEYIKLKKALANAKEKK